MIITCFVVSTIVTPPDVISQITFGLFLIIINELLVLLVILKTKHKNYK